MTSITPFLWFDNDVPAASGLARLVPPPGTVRIPEPTHRSVAGT